MSRGQERRRNLAQQRRSRSEFKDAMQKGGVLARMKHRVRVNIRWAGIRRRIYTNFIILLASVEIIIATADNKVNMSGGEIMGISDATVKKIMLIALAIMVCFLVVIIIRTLLIKIPGEDYHSGYLRPSYQILSGPGTLIMGFMDPLFLRYVLRLGNKGDTR